MPSNIINTTSSTLPPGLTCDQYYLYLSSGYSYSFSYGIMYRPSQVASEQWISTVVHPFRLDETAFWLSHRHYYDFEQRCWTKATFDESEQVQERIWSEARKSKTTQISLQQKADEVMNMLASMSLKTVSQNWSKLPGDLTSKPSIIRSISNKPRKADKSGKREGRKVQIVGSTHKSRRSQTREKIKTLPPTLALNSGYWRSVL
jgi:hypothetical protein